MNQDLRTILSPQNPSLFGNQGPACMENMSPSVGPTMTAGPSTGGTSGATGLAYNPNLMSQGPQQPQNRTLGSIQNVKINTKEFNTAYGQYRNYNQPSSSSNPNMYSQLLQAPPQQQKVSSVTPQMLWNQNPSHQSPQPSFPPNKQQQQQLSLSQQQQQQQQQQLPVHQQPPTQNKALSGANNLQKLMKNLENRKTTDLAFQQNAPMGMNFIQDIHTPHLPSSQTNRSLPHREHSESMQSNTPSQTPLREHHLTPTNQTQTLIQPPPPIDAILQPQCPSIPETQKDAIQFLFNTIAESNFELKANEFKNLLLQTQNRQMFVVWFSSYFVNLRCSKENNHIELYLKLLSFVDAKDIVVAVTKQAYLIINKFLNIYILISEPDMPVKKAVKNLGQFLGLMTLSRNKPVLAKDLDLKETLLKSYDYSSLWLSIPLVCSILKPSIHSTVFKTLNPWVSAILSLLRELHLSSRINLNMKHEVILFF